MSNHENVVARMEPVGQPLSLLVSPEMALIERMVRDPNASLEKLEKMLELKERIDAASARKAFDRAIADAKSEIPPILKERTVDYTTQKGRTTYKHEDLAGIARVVDPILSRHGLSYRFRSHQEGRRLTVTCIVSHRDGYSEETSLSGEPDESGNKNAYQGVGSAATYLQRYTLKLALGLSAAHDDDSKTGGDVAPPATITADQFIELRQLIEDRGIAEDVVLRAEKLDRLDDMPAARFASVRARLLKTEKRA